MAVTPLSLSTTGPETKSQHVSDSITQAFLQPDFDPADYLNNTLPSLSFSSTTAPRATRTAPLSEVSTQLQTLLSQLNAQTSRLSSTLTQLTDDIIRSGSRLAYEVEVLRGETLGLTDALESGLKEDIQLLSLPAQAPTERQDETNKGSREVNEPADALVGEPSTSSDPEFLTRLRTLTAVRNRLDSVIKIFGSAMHWPIAPSELSVTSSLISVSAPEQGADGRSREEKGKQYAEDLRTEINALLSTGLDGLESATDRVEELRSLAEVWKGTAEEKARLKLVEGLQKMVDDRQRSAGRAAPSGRRPGVSPASTVDYRYGNMDASSAGNGSGSGYGFLQNIRNLKNDVY